MQRAANGSSKLYNSKCYGYVHDEEGNLIIDYAQAKNVCMIFDLYVHGKSVIGTVKELERLGIKSPTGKDRWSKRAVDVMFSNEKYIGTFCLLNYGNH